MASASHLSAPITAALRHYFGIDGFRPGQQEACDALLSGQDALVLMPTGGGKSLCYQLPALIARQRGAGLTVVISPLIALMQDQVQQLRQRGIHAVALHSGQDPQQQRALVSDLMQHGADILYASPERAALPGFRNLLQRLHVSFLAIDEAHCMSQWGHDFRPEYMRLGELRQALNVPTIALTATATPRVVDEIVQTLHLHHPMIIRGNFARPNLRFAVHPLPKDAQRLAMVQQTLHDLGLGHDANAGRAIIYCATRKKVESVAQTLKEQHMRVAYYHAGRTDSMRARVQDAYAAGRISVLVATNAFGMGIDQPDVRLVVHFQTPGSLEAYYQEAGRAGRDGKPSTCKMMFGVRDLIMQRQMHQHQGTVTAVLQTRREQGLRDMEAYARSERCRQQVFIHHFTGAATSWQCGTCDICRSDVSDHVMAEAAPRTPTRTTPSATHPVLSSPSPSADHPATRAIIRTMVAELRKPVGKTVLAQALRGSENKQVTRLGLGKSSQHGVLKVYAEKALVEVIVAMLHDGTLVQKGVKYPTVWLPDRPVRSRAQPPARGSTSHDTADPDKTPMQPARRRRRGAREETSDIGRALQRYRRQQARHLGWKPYMILTNAVIQQIIQHQPQTLADLEALHGMGPAKVERFGHDILALVQHHRPAA